MFFIVAMTVRGPLSRHPLLIFACLFLGTLLLFSRSLGFGFLNYDDPRYILNNPYVQDGFTADSLRWVLTGHTDIWNPLVRLTQILDWSLFGADARGHHLHSILWHALNAALAFLLLRRLTGAFWSSALCAALFAWHPLRVESVSWISERKDVVSVACGLLTLLAYAAYAERRAARAPGAWRAYALTLAAFVAALLSKPNMVALPGVFLLLDGWPLRRFAFTRNRAAAATAPGAHAPESPAALLLEKAPFILLAAAAAYITIRTQDTTGCFVLDLPLGARLANAVVSVPRYLGKFFWPFALSVAYPHPGWWPAWVVAAAAAFVLAVTALAWRRRHTAPWIAVGWLWFLGSLAPMIGLLQVGFQSMADRYTYFPMLGWQLALLWTLREYAPRRLPRAALAAAGAGVLLACAARSWDQQDRWRDPVTLYTHALAVTERNDTAHAFLGYTYAGLGRTEEARRHSDLSLATNPHNTLALITRAGLDTNAGLLDEAIASYRLVLTLDPNDKDNALALGRLLARRNQPEEAAAVFHDILRRAPSYSAAVIGLGALELQRNRPEAARALLTEALAAKPGDLALLEQLSLLLIQLGHAEEAAALYARALTLNPASVPYLRSHAGFLQAIGKTDDALAIYSRAIALAPRDPRLELERGQLLALANRPDDALAAFDAALRLQPKFAAADHAAAQILLQRGDPTRATERLRQAVTADPKFLPAHLLLAQIAERAGDTAAADTAFAAALVVAPADAALHRTYGETLAKRRQFAAAIPYFRRAIEVVPGDAAAHAGLGYMFMLTGRRDDALAEWEHTLRLQPDFPGLRERVQQIRTARP